MYFSTNKYKKYNRLSAPARKSVSASREVGWSIEFNAPLDTIEVISEAVFTANNLTDTDKQNSIGIYG